MSIGSTIKELRERAASERAIEQDDPDSPWTSDAQWFDAMADEFDEDIGLDDLVVVERSDLRLVVEGGAKNQDALNAAVARLRAVLVGHDGGQEVRSDDNGI